MPRQLYGGGWVRKLRRGAGSNAPTAGLSSLGTSGLTFVRHFHDFVADFLELSPVFTLSVVLLLYSFTTFVLVVGMTGVSNECHLLWARSRKHHNEVVFFLNH